MPSVVSIQVRIDDNNAAEVLGRIENALAQTGVQGDASIRKLGQSLDQLGGHVTTSLDSVRLLSQEFGLRIPRAMEAMLSRIPAVTSALQGMVGVMAGIGSAEIFVHLGEEIYDAYQKYLSINSAADKFYQTLQKTAQLDFTNVRDLATLDERITIAQREVSKLPEAAKSLQRGGLLSILGGLGSGDFGPGMAQLAAAHTVAGEQAEASGQTLDLARKQLEMDHEAVLAKIELQHALDGELSRRQQIDAEAQKAHQIDAENRLYTRRLEGSFGNPVPKTAGEEEQRRKDAQADAEAAAKRIALNNEVSAAVIKSRNAATEAGLQGEALYLRKEKDAEAEVQAELRATRNEEEGVARITALRAQYAADVLARVRALREETERMNDETAMAGLTGAGRTQAEGAAAIASINRAQSRFSGGAALTPEQQGLFDQQRAAAAARTYQQLRELEQQYTQFTRDQAEQRTAASLDGFQRIAQQEQKQIEDAQKSYNERFGGARLSPDEEAPLLDALNKQKTAIHAEADAQRDQLAARNREQDLSYDRAAMQAEARVRQQGLTGWVNSYKESLAEIEALEQQRIAKMTEEAQREGASQQEIEQRKQDIVRESNAQIAEQNEQLQHTIAGQLQQAFTDPIRYIKQKSEQMMFELIARWIEQLGIFKAIYGNTVGATHPGAVLSGGGVAGSGASNSTGGFGGLLGSILRPSASTGATAGASLPPSGTTGVIRSGVTLPVGYGSEPMGSIGSGYTGDAGGPTAGTRGGASNDVSAAISDTNALARSLGLPPLGVGTGPAAGSGASGGASSGSGPLAGIGGAPTASAALTSTFGIGGTAMAGYAGAEGVLDAFHQGGVGGALHGTMSGAELGASIGSVVPGIGTAIGAAIGAVAGLTTNLIGDVMGESGRFAARDYYKQTLYPELERLRNSSSTGDYLAGISEANRDAAQGMDYMSGKWGSSAAAWVNANYLQKELDEVVTALGRRASGGAQYATRSAAQFHSGGFIRDFADLATSGSEGFIHAMVGEHVTTPGPAQAHAPYLNAINSGADAATMASMYLQGSGASPRGSSSPQSSGHTLHIHAMDARSFKSWMRAGGARMVNEALNEHVGTYGGDAIG